MLASRCICSHGYTRHHRSILWEQQHNHTPLPRLLVHCHIQHVSNYRHSADHQDKDFQARILRHCQELRHHNATASLGQMLGIQIGQILRLELSLVYRRRQMMFYVWLYGWLSCWFFGWLSGWLSSWITCWLSCWNAHAITATRATFWASRGFS